MTFNSQIIVQFKWMAMNSNMNKFPIISRKQIELDRIYEAGQAYEVLYCRITVDFFENYCNTVIEFLYNYRQSSIFLFEIVYYRHR